MNDATVLALAAVALSGVALALNLYSLWCLEQAQRLRRRR